LSAMQVKPLPPPRTIRIEPSAFIATTAAPPADRGRSGRGRASDDRGVLPEAGPGFASANRPRRAMLHPPKARSSCHMPFPPPLPASVKAAPSCRAGGGLFRFARDRCKPLRSAYQSLLRIIESQGAVGIRAW
jgi:hypothetical protein